MKQDPRPAVRRIREQLDHPIVDADAHQLEVMPLVLEYLRDVAGPEMADEFAAYLGRARRTFSMTPEERLETRTPMPVWWPVPAENTLDRATTTLPALLHERMDELGLDFSIVYPGIGLQVVTLPGIPDDDLRRAAARALNRYYADAFRDYADRLTPAAVIPMNTPEEAIAELDSVVGELGFKAAVMGGDVLRPIPCVEREHPELADWALYSDTFGLDSPYDYDPFWARCVELGVAVTSHSGPIGWGTRRSVSRHQYNQLGGFAEGGEALCKSLFMGGVTNRFPTLNVAFLEGGVAWACDTYSRMVDHWKKRGGENIQKLNPKRLDGELMLELLKRYGDPRIQPIVSDLVGASLWSPCPEELDDWRDCGIEKAEDICRLFVPRFYFGCEADDRMNALAFDQRLNPFGARLRAIFSSDLGHFDVVDMREVVEEAWELVDEGLMDAHAFADFTFGNVVRLHGGMNPDFFKGTVVEKQAAALLSSEAAGGGASA